MYKSKPKILVISHDLSENCLGRAYIIAMALKRKYNVVVAGFSSKKDIWYPLRLNEDVVFMHLKSFSDILRLRKENYEFVYAIKPLLNSFGVSLIITCFSKKKLVLDIDDWELGFFLDYSLARKIRSIVGFMLPNAFLQVAIFDFMAKGVQLKTVSNSFLQNRYGGQLLPHFRGTNKFNPVKYDGRGLRKEHNVENKNIILFLGTSRSHKGIDLLINAYSRICDSDTVLMVVGADTPFHDAKRNIIQIGKIPFDNIPMYISAADIVVIPQRYSNASKGQLPAKLFDAMSMSKAIVSTDVSDIKEILRDCGMVIDPNNELELAEKLSYLLKHPQEREILGNRARVKCVEKYSYESAIRMLERFLDIK